MEDAFLIVGLGNPGREFRDTRHNIGFMLLDRLAVKVDTRFARLQSKALVASSTYASKKMILAKPQTYMNISGQSVQGLVRFYKISMGNLLVVYDDLDLPIETIRIRPEGGSAGHKGMSSIIERLGTDQFARMRLGIGRPPGQMQAPDYVLQEFSKAEANVVSLTLNRAVDAVLEYVLNNLDSAMNKFNGIA